MASAAHDERRGGQCGREPARWALWGNDGTDDTDTGNGIVWQCARATPERTAFDWRAATRYTHPDERA